MIRNWSDEQAFSRTFRTPRLLEQGMTSEAVERPSASGFVTGHDFSRAEIAAKVVPKLPQKYDGFSPGRMYFSHLSRTREPLW
jgi:hypothetical protein